MRVHVLQHVAFEGLGSIEDWLAARGAVISYTRFYEEPSLPDLADIDLVIALGGPMSVNDETDLPWLVAEKRFVSEAIAADKAVLGICLGAQLIASAQGARVYPGPQKEIGWFPIFAAEPQNGAFRFPQEATVFHWHGETFDLPAGAVRLAGSAVNPNQAFQIGARVIGLQFHLETTPQSAAAMIQHCGDELIPASYVQSAADLQSTPATHYAGVNALMGEILSCLSR